MRTATKKKAKAEKIVIPSHWNTSDDDEVNRRRLRAQTEAMHIAALNQGGNYFTDYSVRSVGSGNAYTVEIRSLTERINSCTCADYDGNCLGTCKHIEKTLIFLKKKGVGKFKKALGAGNPRTEIFVHPQNDTVNIIWSADKDSHFIARRLVGEFFSSSGHLLAEVEIAIPAIRHAVEKAGDGATDSIRLSRKLDMAYTRGLNASRRQATREHFLQDVRDGTSSLEIMKLPLYNYQQQGMLHLAFAERAILADEMGLGKTVQAVAACELLRRLYGIKRVLVVSPTSLKSEWEEQIAKFSELSSTVVMGRRQDRLCQYDSDSFFILTNYEQILRDRDDIQRLIAPDVVILDEAQRIKNWRTKTSNTIKLLQSRFAFVLTGTPIENRIDDLYSIVQFLDTRFFGSLFRFNREYYQLDDNGKPIGYKNLDELHGRVRPILLRRRKSEVEGELPERVVNNYFVTMTDEQNRHYADYEGIVAKLASVAQRRALLPKEFDRLQLSLASMRMLCDTPYILDDKCRICPKLDELSPLLEELLEDESCKIIIFSEWERMLMLVRELLIKRDIGLSWHTGSVEQKKRTQEIGRFKNDPLCRVFLSTDAGSVGLNLQIANVVINMDLPWNPAKLEQRIARAWRKHQTRSVRVINLISENTIEHRMLSLLKQKQALADNVLELGGEASMDMPSGRAALMERLNEILDQSSVDNNDKPDVKHDEEVKERTPLEYFQGEVLASLKPRLVRMEAYENTVLAVVEGEVNESAAVLQQLLADADPEQSLKLEVLDNNTYAVIQRLIESGVLAWGNAQVAPLHQQAAQAADIQREARLRRIREVREILAQAERKIKMAGLLISGGFNTESLPALHEAHKIYVNALDIVNAIQNMEQKTACLNDMIQKVATQLTESGGDDATGLLESISEILELFEACLNHEMMDGVS